MLRHIPQPLHTGGLEADVGVEAAGDGAVDDGLLLLLQQLDQLLLGADVPPNPPVRVVEEADDGSLFGEGWKGDMECSKPRFRDCRVGNSHGLCSDPVRECIALTNITHELGYAARGWRENSEAGRAHEVIRFGVDKVDCLQVRTDSGHDRVTIPNNSPRPRWRGSETQALGSSCEYAGAHRANVYVSEFVAGWRVLGKHSSVHSDPVLQWKRRPVLRH